MKKGKRIIAGAVLTLILLAGAYRLWPRSFKSIAGGETGELAEASCFLTVNSFESGMSFYELKTGDPALAGGLLDILESCRYQGDFRNLIPGGPDSLGSGRNYDGRHLEIELRFAGREEPFSLHLADRDSGLCGYGIVHPTNGDTFAELAEYVQEHGVPWTAGLNTFTSAVRSGIREGYMLRKIHI